jgi:hypothetical protein
MSTPLSVEKNTEIPTLKILNGKEYIQKQIVLDSFAPVKKNKETTDFDVLNLQEWVIKKVILNPSATTSLKDCYEAYKKYLEVEKRMIPLTKKSFSGIFKHVLKKYENQGQIRFYQRSSIFIKGIEINILLDNLNL